MISLRSPAERLVVHRAFELFTQCVIVLSIVSFTLATDNDLAAQYTDTFSMLERFCLAVFTAEYLIRIIAAERPSKFAFSFFGIVDLIAILPFYLALGLDLRSVRAIRLLLLFRMLKFARYSRSLTRYAVAFRLAREDMVLFLSASVLLIYVAAVGIYYFEGGQQPDRFGSIGASLWWAVVTLTTVGYGDVFPVTTGGRLFTFLILMVGVGFISVPSGIMASALSEARRREREERLTDPEQEAGG